MSELNEHVLLVMRWLQNSDLVSLGELKANYRSSSDVYYDAYAAAYKAAYDAYDAAAAAAARAAYNASNADDDAKHWLSVTKKYLDEYFETTKKDREAYENRAKHLNILGAKNG